MDVGENLKKIRQIRGLHQEDLSKKSGVPQSAISRIESGSDFLWSKLLKITNALEVNVQDVLTEKGKLNFTLIGDKTKGLVINHPSDEKAHEQIIQLLREENQFLRKIVEQSISSKKPKTKDKNQSLKKHPNENSANLCAAHNNGLR